MLLMIYQYFKRKNSKWRGKIFKILYSSFNLKVGKNFQCDTFPSILIDKQCNITIGDNVVFRRNVEMRSHGTSHIKIGNNVRIDRGVRILAANKSVIEINNNTRLGLYTVLNGGDSILIGEKVLISGFVYLQTSTHNYRKGIPILDQGFEHKKINVGNDVWIGAHSVIFPGVKIGNGAIIGSNTVVNRNVKSNLIALGVPFSSLSKRQ